MIQYGRFSGFKINWKKSQIFPLTDFPKPTGHSVPLRWRPEGVRYLGVWVTRDMTELNRRNSAVALESIHTSVERWIRLPLSQLGRVSLIKMIILP